MKQETRNLLIILTVVLVYLSYRYLGVESILIHGYIITYVLDIIARKEIEPKNKGREIMGIADWTITFHSKIAKKVQGLGIVLTVVGLVVAVVVGIWLDRVINMGILAYTLPLWVFLFLLDISLRFKTVNVYEKGIQRGCKFYTWDEVELNESTHDGVLEITYVNNLIWKNQLRVARGMEEIKELKNRKIELI